MSDLSVRAVAEGAVGTQRTAAKPQVGAAIDAGAGASANKKSAPDVSNYVTSPKGVVDPQSGVYVLQYRDGATGEVLNQYPSEKVVDAYKRSAASGEAVAKPVVAEGGSTEGAVKAAVSAPSQPVPSSGPAVATGTTSTVGEGASSPTPTTLTSVEA